MRERPGGTLGERSAVGTGHGMHPAVKMQVGSLCSRHRKEAGVTAQREKESSKRCGQIHKGGQILCGYNEKLPHLKDCLP